MCSSHAKTPEHLCRKIKSNSQMYLMKKNRRSKSGLVRLRSLVALGLAFVAVVLGIVSVAPSKTAQSALHRGLQLANLKPNFGPRPPSAVLYRPPSNSSAIE